MAVPTITTVTPALGHSGGKTLIEIDGTNFALPPAPVAAGPTTAPPPSVTVTVGGVPATAVAVVSATLIYCLTPKGDPDAGALDVVLQNNNASGVPIGGEVVTKMAAFTYQRPDLTEESELARVVRALIQELKRQIHKNVVLSQHTDYDDSTGDLLNLAAVESLPALILGNLEIPEDRVHAVQSKVEFDIGNGRFIARRAPTAVDVNVTLVGVTDNPITALNLMQAVRGFFKKNPYLTLDRDGSDPSQGTVSYEMDWSFGGPVAVSHQGDNSNVESFGGSITLRGVILEDIPGISRTKPAAIPAHFPHEATTSIGGISADTAVPTLDAQTKT
jgi:hypothetical protein